MPSTSRTRAKTAAKTAAMPADPFRHAMLLAAGLGTRMRPLTDTLPKPLVPVGGRTLADHVLDRLAAAGVGTVVVNVHYRAEQMRRHLARRRQPRIVVSDETDRLADSGGGVRRALPWLGEAPFIVCNADSFWLDGDAPALPAMIRAWDGTRMDILMLLAPLATSTGYDGSGDYARDETTGRLTRRRRPEPVPYAYAGVLLTHPGLFAGRPDVFSLNRLFDEAETAGRLFGHCLDGAWLHVGTPAAIGQAEARMAETRLAKPGAPAASTTA